MTTITRKLNLWDRLMMAVAFAESDDDRSAKELLEVKSDNAGERRNRRVLQTCADIR